MLFALLTACLTSTTYFYEVCDLELDVPASGVPGDPLVITGGPVVDLRDTSVRLDGVPVAVQEVVRTECAACDICREAAECSSCATCFDCVDTCSSCVETTTIALPDDLPVGPVTVTMINGYGSGSAVLVVDGAPASSTGDTGSAP